MTPTTVRLPVAVVSPFFLGDVAGALGFLEKETIDLLLTDLQLGAETG